MQSLKLVIQQKQLINLDPKTYKDLTPSMLDNRIKKALQFSTVRGAFDVPQSLTPSFEHFQGIVPGTIAKDPKALSKVGITTKDFNEYYIHKIKNFRLLY